MKISQQMITRVYHLENINKFINENQSYEVHIKSNNNKWRI